jgi:hypothetical protein
VFSNVGRRSKAMTLKEYENLLKALGPTLRDLYSPHSDLLPEQIKNLLDQLQQREGSNTPSTSRAKDHPSAVQEK